MRITAINVYDRNMQNPGVCWGFNNNNQEDIMKIPERFEHKKPVFSFEIFPPKRQTGLDKIYDTIETLSVCKPDFISVTYGAGGNMADNSTCEIAANIKKGLESNHWPI